MRILVLADIHFRHGEHGAPDDVYAHVRDAFFRAVETLRSQGTVDLVLIAGDLAFAGKAAEYEIAAQFLATLRARLAQDSLDVIAAPGNHDFDRGVLSADPLLEYVHTTAKPSIRKGDEKTHGAFGTWMRSKNSRATILSPLAAFRQFAASIGEELEPTTGSAKPQLRQLHAGVELRIFAISSAIMASSDDDRGSLLVEPAYRSIRRDQPGVVNLVLMHHPPNWAANAVEVTRQLRLFADIVVVGHEHTPQNYAFGDTLTWIDAGSLQPETTGKAVPHFAVVDLKPSVYNDQVEIAIDLYVHRYRAADDKFVVERDAVGTGATFQKVLRVTPSIAPGVAKPASEQRSAASTAVESKSPDIGAVRAAFFKLGSADRAIICDGAGVPTFPADLADVVAHRQWASIVDRGLVSSVNEIMTRLELEKSGKHG